MVESRLDLLLVECATEARVRIHGCPKPPASQPPSCTPKLWRRCRCGRWATASLRRPVVSGTNRDQSLDHPSVCVGGAVPWLSLMT